MERTARSLNTTYMLWFLTVCLLLGLSLFQFSSRHIYFTNDGASTFAVAEGILAGELPQAGPPAARGGRHAGPWYFYWQALCLALSGGSIFGGILIETLLKSLFLALGSIALLRLLSREQLQPASFIALGLAFLAGSWWWVLRTPWHSNFIASSSCVFLLLLLRALNQASISFAALILVASFFLQAHLATAPLVLAGLFSVGILRLLQKTPLEETHRIRSAIYYALAFLTWMPTFLFLQRGEGRLFGQVVNSSAQAAHIGLASSLTLSGKIFRRFIINDHNWGTLASPLPPWTEGVFFAVFIVALLSVAVRSDALIRRRFAVLFTVIAAYVVAISLLRPPVHFHYEHSIIILAPIFAALSFQECWRWLFTSHIPLRLSGLLFLVLFLFIGGRASLQTAGLLQSPPFGIHQTLLHAEEFAAELSQLRPDANSTTLIINERDRLRESAIYLFLGRDFFWKMQYARYFNELPAFQKPTSADNERLLVTSCENRDASAVERHLKGFALKDEISLEGCSSCSSCRLSDWRREASLSR